MGNDEIEAIGGINGKSYMQQMQGMQPPPPPPPDNEQGQGIDGKRINDIESLMQLIQQMKAKNSWD
ncbi:MAG: hypothetical protein AB2L14_35200 [Candidatus Xenobiia bacterium LiM19]